MTFFEKVMEEIGVTEENNKITVTNEEAEFPMSKVTERKIWTETKNGDIQILYYTIDRKVYSYTQIGDGKMSHANGKPKEWVQIRLQHPKEGGRKYKNPYKQPGNPFFHPILCDKYERCEEIETLYLTEGAKKAWVGCEKGMDVVGLLSINVYKNDEKTGLHQEIIKLILRCNVKNVVILWDGDCRDVSDKAISIGKPITDRPVGFFANARNLRDNIVNIPMEQDKKMNVYFMAVESDNWEEKPKGLDDLLQLAVEKEKINEVVKDAKKVNGRGPYFKRINITKGIKKLHEWFMLHNVQSFYSMHEHIIGEDPFFFFDDYCVWQDGDGDKNPGKVVIITYGWTKNVRWVGDEFFELVSKPGAGRDRKKLVKYNKDTMIKRFGKDFHKHLDFYSDFCNVPSHFNYQQEILRDGKRFYNLYFPFSHLPKEGSFDTIMYFIKHIFGTGKVKHSVTGQIIDEWDLGLDYLQLMLMNPTQRLPILCLYSNENNTGKSTFGNFQLQLLGDNAVKVGNNDLTSDFNETYAGKVLAFCEETLLERKKDSERIKDMSTAKYITVNPKGQRQFTIDFFCKFQFYSNNIRMIYVTEYDERYWVRKVPKATKDDPHLEDKMTREIPAFIHFLQRRELVTKEESRMWMHFSWYKTGTLSEMVRVNEPADVSVIRDGVENLFVDFPEVQQISLPMQNIKSEFFSKSVGDKWLKQLLNEHLEVFRQRNDAGKVVVRHGTYQKRRYNEHLEDFEIKTVKTFGRHYIFNRNDFVPEEAVNLEELRNVGEEEFEPDPKDVKKLPISESDELPF